MLLSMAGPGESESFPTYTVMRWPCTESGVEGPAGQKSGLSGHGWMWAGARLLFWLHGVYLSA